MRKSYSDFFRSIYGQFNEESVFETAFPPDSPNAISA